MNHPHRRQSLREKLHLRMAHMDNLGHLALLGIIAGLLTGLVIIAFRLLTETIQSSFLPDQNPENYEALSAWLRFTLPVIGGLLVGILFQSFSAEKRAVGVVHVMERLAYHQARLPLMNGILQFIGASICIIFGHSVGREGPAVHIGAVSGSQLGQWLHLPNHSNRVLVACGVAAAIAASFNTPLAGVIFSMEVVLMEYTIAGFIPVILAAVAATAVSQLFFGNEPAFNVPPLQLGSLYELPYVLLIGLIIGCLAALFIYSLTYFSGRAKSRPLWQRTTLGGVIVGICAVIMPPIMGIGYDTVNSAMLGDMGIGLLLLVVLFKLLATSAGLGLGLPGGLIGPTLVIGAAAGAAASLIAVALGGDNLSSPALYAMIGMGAMMGATLQAPLAALTALLELTANPNIILPGMLAIVGANLVSSQVFGKDSVFLVMLRARGFDYDQHPVTQALRRTGVSRAMDRDVIHTPELLSYDAVDQILHRHPHWFFIDEAATGPYILPASDIAKAVKIKQETPATDEAETQLNLHDIPAARRQVAAIDVRATLQEALETLQTQRADALYVVADQLAENHEVLGILTREDIEEHYRYPAAKN